MNLPVHGFSRFEQVENGMFLIVGCGRSGTTLLKTILNAHPSISLPHETNFFTGISSGDFECDETSLEQKLDRLLSKWWIADMHLDRNEIKQNLGEHKASWRNLFVAMLASLPTAVDACCFGEKTVDHIIYAEELLTQFPHAKLLQVIRDPRASFASYRAASIGTNQPSRFVSDWELAVTVDQKLESHPRYFRIKFEDLIENTEATMQKICDFLEVEFAAEMMNYHQREVSGYSPEQSHHSNTQKPIFKSGIEKWKHELTNTHVAMIEFFLGQQMQRVGYELTEAAVKFPQSRMWLSGLYESVAKNLIRRPRQRWKAMRAKMRQSKS